MVTGPNTGFFDVVDVLALLLQRSLVTRDEVETVILENCRRRGHRRPEGMSLRRRVERLKATMERGGVVIGLVSSRGGVERRSDGGWWLEGTRCVALVHPGEEDDDQAQRCRPAVPAAGGPSVPGHGGLCDRRRAGPTLRRLQPVAV